MRRGSTGAVAGLAFALAFTSAGAELSWPSLSVPPPRHGAGASADVAVIFGAEKYFVVSPVPGASLNANDWYRYLTTSQGVPVPRVRLRRDELVTRENILDSAAWAASQAKPGSTVWFIFIG